jgi:hypothetical protein
MVSDQLPPDYKKFVIKDLFTDEDIIDITERALYLWKNDLKADLVRIYTQAVIDQLARKRLINTGN